jgi:hypothetical protein
MSITSAESVDLRLDEFVLVVVVDLVAPIKNLFISHNVSMGEENPTC